MDENTFAHYQTSKLEPFPRKYVAELLRTFKKLHVRLAVLDFVFSDKGADPTDDEVFASALQEFPTVLAEYQEQRSIDEPNILVRPLPLFQKNAAATASVALTLDEGVVRRFSLMSEWDGDRGVAKVIANRLQVKSLPSDRDLVNFYGPARAVFTIPFENATGELDAATRDFLDGSIVFVGLEKALGSANMNRDFFLTSYAKTPIAGVEVFATMTANIIHGTWIRRMNPSTELVLLNVVIFLLAILLTNFPPTLSLIGLVAVEIIWGLISYRAFLAGYFLPGATALLLLPVLVALSVLMHYRRIRRKHGLIESTFGLKIRAD